MRLALYKKAIYALTCLLLALAPAVGQAQRSDEPIQTASPTTIFNEIELSPEGIVAYDTSGNRWVYDFSLEAFVPGELASTGPETGESGGEATMAIPPVEERCIVPKTVKPYQREVLVGYDEYVDGDITAYGRITVRGWVKGSILSYNGMVEVTESGQVNGDIMAPKVEVQPGGTVYGEITQTGSLTDLPRDVLSYSFSAGGLWVVTGFTIFFLFGGFIAITLASRQVNRFRQCIAKYPVKSFMIGLLGTVLMPMVILFVVITIIGVLVVPFVPLVYIIAFTLGIVTFSQIVGGSLVSKYSSRKVGAMLSFVVGLAMLMALWYVVAILLGSGDSVSYGFGIFFLVLSITYTSYQICAGVGAAILTRFGFRDYVSFDDRVRTAGEATRPPAPPPIPKVPPIVRPPEPPSFPGDDDERPTPPDRRPPLPSSGDKI